MAKRHFYSVRFKAGDKIGRAIVKSMNEETAATSVDYHLEMLDSPYFPMQLVEVKRTYMKYNEIIHYTENNDVDL